MKMTFLMKMGIWQLHIPIIHHFDISLDDDDYGDDDDDDDDDLWGE